MPYNDLEPTFARLCSKASRRLPGRRWLWYPLWKYAIDCDYARRHGLPFSRLDHLVAQLRVAWYRRRVDRILSSFQASHAPLVAERSTNQRQRLRDS